MDKQTLKQDIQKIEKRMYKTRDIEVRMALTNLMMILRSWQAEVKRDA